MKRTRMAAVATAVLAGLSLTACGGGDDEGKDNKPSASASATQNGEDKDNTGKPDYVQAPKAAVLDGEPFQPKSAPKASLMLAFKVPAQDGTSTICDVVAAEDGEITKVARFEPGNHAKKANITHCGDPFTMSENGQLRVAVDESDDKLVVMKADGSSQKLDVGERPRTPVINPADGRIYYWDGAFDPVLRTVATDGSTDREAEYNKSLVKPGSRFGFLAGEPVDWAVLFNEHHAVRVASTTTGDKTTAALIDGKLEIGPLSGLTTNPEYKVVSSEIKSSFGGIAVTPKVMENNDSFLGVWDNYIVRGKIDHDAKTVTVTKVTKESLNDTLGITPRYDGTYNRQVPSVKPMWLDGGHLYFVLRQKATFDTDNTVQTHVVKVDTKTGETVIDTNVQFKDGKDSKSPEGVAFAFNR